MSALLHQVSAPPLVAEIDRLRASHAALLSSLIELRAEHSRIEPHHEDMCGLCMRADLAIAAAQPVEWRDDKPSERTDRFVTTGEGDLDIAGRPLKAGR